MVRAGIAATAEAGEAALVAVARITMTAVDTIERAGNGMGTGDGTDPETGIETGVESESVTATGIGTGEWAATGATIELGTAIAGSNVI